MKILILVTIILSVNLHSYEFIRNENLDKHQIFESMELVNDNLYILTRKSYDKTLKKGLAGLFQYSTTGEFKEIEMSYIEDNINHNIYLNTFGKFTSNSKGELFYISDAIYKYSNNSWNKIQFSEFSEGTLFTQLVFDKNDNLWFVCFNTTKSNFEGGLYKFDGANLTKIHNGLFDNSIVNSSNLLVLENGNIVAQRYWDQSEEDYAKFNQEDLWIFDSTGNLVTTELIELSSGLPNYQDYNVSSENNINKKISQIYETSKNDIFISTMARTLYYQEDGKMYPFSCCESLSRYNPKADSWKVFTKEDGLQLNSKSKFVRYDPVYGVKELLDKRILFTGSKGFYIINENGKIVRIDSDFLLENGKFIVFGDELNDKEVFNFRVGTLFGNGYDAIAQSSLGFSNIKIDSKGNMYFFYSYGIFIINENNFLISDVEDKQDELSLYPNPSNNKITISGIGRKNSYKIMNLLGEVVLEGIYSETIDISNLSKGHYFIQINDVNKIKNLKFIKN